MPTVDCDRYSCLYNDCGFCEADMINVIDTNCETYEDNSYEMMDDIEREEYNRFMQENEE